MRRTGTCARDLRGLFGAACAVALPLMPLISGCSGKVHQAGGLEIIVKSDLAVPLELNAVSIDISQRSGSAWVERFHREVVLSGPVELPATFTIAAGSSADQEALVDITGLDGQGHPTIFSESLVQVPTDRVAEIIVFLGKTCVGKLSVASDGGVTSGCQAGETCDPNNGGCMPSLIADPPNYQPQDITNDASVPAETDAGDAGDATLSTEPDAGDGGCADGSCGAACPSGQTMCDGGCAALSTDPRNCGVCGNDCSELANVSATGASCSAGRCAYVCQPAYADCADAGAGCATYLGSTASCGGCGAACGTSTPVCGGSDAGAYACTSSCPSGDTDCSGTCAALASDPNHCGACGKVCSLPHANATCASAACAIASCSAGFADCNGTAADGCEVDTTSSAANCGGCGLGCTTANATPACVGSTCAIGACSSGYTDCDGLASTGCEVHTAADPNNCGGCGHVCSLANANATCSAGACAVGSCKAGYADCDGVASNGCETNLAVAAHCGACTGSACSGGTPVCSASNGTYSCVSGCPGSAPTLCNGTSCVDTTSDPNNCGGCGMGCAVPHATAKCASSTCGVGSCSTGFADCNGAAIDGCETATTSDPNNCGGCGNVCTLAHASATCTSSSCAVASCTPGFADCDHVASNGCEVNTASSAGNCGACGTVCSLPNATSACSASACAVAVCNTGFGDCDGVASNGCEANLQSDPNHCGACGTACGTGKLCVNGGCAGQAVLTIGPSPVNYGAVAPGTTSPDQTFTVQNTGGVPTGTITTSITGSTPAQFVISSNTCTGALLGGTSCAIKVHFSPNVAGPYSAMLGVSASPGGSAQATLSGSASTACGEFVADTGTIALWHFNEGSGLTTADSSGNGHTGTLGNSTTANTADPTWVAGRFGGALSYAQANQQYVQGAGSNTFPNDQVTVEFWERGVAPFGSSSPGYSQPFTAGFICVAVNMSQQDMEFGVGNGTNWSYPTTSTTALMDGNWHYVAYVFDSVNQTFYVDGALVAAATASPVTALTSTGGNGYQIGGRPSNTFFNGVIDEMRISSVARTGAQIANYYTSAVSCPVAQ